METKQTFVDETTITHNLEEQVFGSTRQSLGKIAGIKSLSNARILSIAIGIVYLWFGALKFFTGLSPAEELATNTITVMTFGMIPAEVSLILLAIWEVAVGVCLIFWILPRTTVYVAIAHMICTFLPLVFFPGLCFTEVPYGLTLVGQYIMKNILFLGALVILLRYIKGQPTA